MSESTCETKGYRLSFLELFQQYGHIEIPLIQRDYAQGRESAKAVRDRFLDSLLDALKNENDHWLSLDFIYGEVVSEAEGKFQPIDGQQRLTTLFLLHWYLACVVGKQGKFADLLRDGKTPRFQYSVRKSSDQFFDRLLDFSPNLANPLPEQIKEQAWFFRAWKHDPTIQGALVMLEAIQQQFPANIEQTKTFYDKLCLDNCPITFDVLNLGSLGLSDEIYIKMNARGKELTGFEKFKAWLIENRWETNKLSWPENPDATKQWPILLDGDWLDLFWSFRNPTDPNPSESVSKAHFQAFVALAVNFHASKDNFPEEWMTADCDDQRSLWDSIFTKPALQHVFQSLRNLSSVNKDGLDDLRNSLKNKGISFFKESANSKDCPWNAFLEGDTKPGLRERLWLHALCLFLASPKIGAPRSETLRDDWFRVMRNLIENTTFRQENFSNAVQSVSALAKKCLSHLESGKNRPVLSALADISFVEELEGFDGHQKKEESKKAGRMLEVKGGSEWEKMFIEAENHPVFRGQIAFLLEETTTLDLFQKRWAVVNDLLDDGGSKISNGEYLLARAAFRWAWFDFFFDAFHDSLRLFSCVFVEFKSAFRHVGPLFRVAALGR